MLDVWDVSDVQIAQYCHNEPGNTLLLDHITTGEYVACYIISLFQKVNITTYVAKVVLRVS